MTGHSGKANAEGMVSLILRDAGRLFGRVWGRAVIVCFVMVFSLLAIGGVLQLFGVPIFEVQPEPGWRFDIFLFNWLGWLLNYLAYTALVGKMLAGNSRAGKIPNGLMVRAGVPVFMLMAMPSAFVSTWMPDGDLTREYIIMMVPQSLFDVSLSVCALFWFLRRLARRADGLASPDWREMPTRVSLTLVILLAGFLIGSELLYTALGSIEWQVMTGSDDLSAIMGLVALIGAIVALYLNVIVTPSLIAAWYRNLPSVKASSSGIREIFA